MAMIFSIFSFFYRNTLSVTRANVKPRLYQVLKNTASEFIQVLYIHHYKNKCNFKANSVRKIEANIVYHVQVKQVLIRKISTIRQS